MKAIAALLLSCALLVGLTAEGRGGQTNATLVPLPLKLPLPSWGANGPYETPEGPNIEPPLGRPRAAFLAPLGATNLALGRPVTASVPRPARGKLSMITDGEKEDGLEEASLTNVVELPRGLQWVQVDLESECQVSAVVVWHDFYYHQPVFRKVVVLAASDAGFTGPVHVLFNNDPEGVAGHGKGSDKQYVESYEGKLIDAGGIQARYLRFYSAGSNNSPLNGYVEIEVWGLPSAPPS